MDMEPIRSRIDAVDDAILELLAERQGLAGALGEAKRERGFPIYDPQREEGILARLFSRNADRLSPAAVRAVWREVFSASRQAQQPTRVAYLGPEGTFTQLAALTRFGSSAELVAANGIAAAFGWVLRKTVDYAVLPVENTLQGVVGETVDLLGAARQPLIVGEIVAPIHFVFSSRAETLREVRTVYSKKEAFRQCSNFLNQPALELARQVPVASTAEAALRAADDPAGAALSAGIAASQAGVPIRFDHVENDVRNKTRFLVLGHHRPPRTGDDKTSVFAKAPNVAGGLEGVLKSFRLKNINLTKIESRPMDDAVNFETWFYIDFDGHADDAEVRAMLDSHDLVWMGSYPKFRAGAMGGNPRRGPQRPADGEGR